MPYNNVQFLLILSGSIKYSTQSIAGVTYMDDFDFEERYRDVTECDPFHWYPLHLPPNCLELYEDLIRTGIRSNIPLRVVKEKKSMVYSLDPSEVYSTVSFNEFIQPKRHLTPYEKMFSMLRKDVEKEPSAPQITTIPGLGLVALYRQPISRKSGQYVKRISGAYRDANFGYNPVYEKIEYTEKPNTKDNENQTNNPDNSKENIINQIKNMFGP